MNCRTFLDRADEFLDSLLPDEEARDVRSHAEQCPECARELRAAEKFRAFLAGTGHDAIEVAAARRAVESVRAEQVAASVPAPAPAPRGRRLALRFAAAAALVLAAWGGYALAPREEAPRTAMAVGAPAHVERGVALVPAEGRSVLVDEDSLLSIVPGSKGGRVRLDAGAAMFQVERGRPFVVETPQGDAEVLGTLFHVEVRSDRSVSVAVLSGAVRFEPRGSQARRTLRAGTILDVDPEGRQRLVSRALVNDLETRAGMQEIELAALQGEVMRLEDALAASKAPIASSEPPMPAAADASSIPWNEIGAAARRLLESGEGFDDPQSMVALSVFYLHAPELKRVTGSAHPFEWPLHPVVLTRAAPAFFAALAPDASADARAAAVALVNDAGATLTARLGPDATPTETLYEKLRFLKSFVEATRTHLGDGPAAAVARALQRARDGAPIRVVPVGNDPAAEIAREWTKAFGLDPEQALVVSPAVRRYVESAMAAQETVLANLGTTEAEPLLFPEFRPWRPRPTSTSPAATDEEVLAKTLRRIGAKMTLAEPRIELERTVRQVLRPEQTSKGFLGWGLPTLRSHD